LEVFGKHSRRTSPALGTQEAILSEKQQKGLGAWFEYLPSKHRALSSIPSTEKKKKNPKQYINHDLILRK
jgi:hypothetical protein